MDDELFLEQVECGPMQNFVYAVGSRATREVALVDPAWAIEPLLAHVREQGYEPVAALVTHYHPDHVGGRMMGQSIEGLRELLDAKGMKVYANKHEADGLKKITGVSENDLVRVESGDAMRIGNVEIEFLHTPGHTPGSQCFRVKNALVSGDTLFIQGCGRVDLPGSDPDEMFASLRKLADLPDDTVLYPGHDYGGGPHRTLAETKRMNPYLRIPTLEMWHEIMGG
jgi:hydroxyacylglutathione hydrolase